MFRLLRLLAKDYGVWSLVVDYRDFILMINRLLKYVVFVIFRTLEHIGIILLVIYYIYDNYKKKLKQ